MHRARPNPALRAPPRRHSASLRRGSSEALRASRFAPLERQRRDALAAVLLHASVEAGELGTHEALLVGLGRLAVGDRLQFGIDRPDAGDHRAAADQIDLAVAGRLERLAAELALHRPPGT